MVGFVISHIDFRALGVRVRALGRGLRTIGAVTLGTLGGCGYGSAGTERLQVITWWSTPGEDSAFESFVANFQDSHPGLEVHSDARHDGNDARFEVQTEMLENSPPNTFQTLAGKRLHDWIPHLESLENLLPSETWDRMFKLDLEGSADSSHYCVPLDLQRENSLFYSREIFDRYGLTPPTTWEQFEAVAKDLQNKQDKPVLALGASEAWGVRLLFQTVMFSSTLKSKSEEESEEAPDDYERFFAGDVDLDHDGIFRQAAEKFVDVLQYVDKDSEAYGWAEAIEKVASAEAAMLIHGDWALGQLGERQAQVGERAAPDTGGWFLFSSDCFPLPKGLDDRQRVDSLKFLQTVASGEGQNAFNLKKGSIPAFRVPDIGRYGDLGRARISDAESADKAGHFVRSFPLHMSYSMERLIEPIIEVLRSDYTRLLRDDTNSHRSEADREAIIEAAVKSISSIYSGFKE